MFLIKSISKPEKSYRRSRGGYYKLTLRLDKKTNLVALVQLECSIKPTKKL